MSVKYDYNNIRQREETSSFLSSGTKMCVAKTWMITDLGNQNEPRGEIRLARKAGKAATPQKCLIAEMVQIKQLVGGRSPEYMMKSGKGAGNGMLQLLIFPFPSTLSCLACQFSISCPLPLDFERLLTPHFVTLCSFIR